MADFALGSSPLPAPTCLSSGVVFDSDQISSLYQTVELLCRAHELLCLSHLQGYTQKLVKGSDNF